MDDNQDLTYDQAVDEIAKRYGVPSAVWRRMIRQESGGNSSAVSPKGARTAWQIMPGTARQLGYTPEELDAEPLKAAEAGLRYLRDNFKQVSPYTQNEKHGWMAAVGAYHAGPGAVLKDLKKGGYGLPDISDGSITTKDHVLKIFDGLKGDEINRSPVKPVTVPITGTGSGESDTPDTTVSIATPHPAQETAPGVYGTPEQSEEFNKAFPNTPVEVPRRVSQVLKGAAESLLGTAAPEQPQTPPMAKDLLPAYQGPPTLKLEGGYEQAPDQNGVKKGTTRVTKAGKNFLAAPKDQGFTLTPETAETSYQQFLKETGVPDDENGKQAFKDAQAALQNIEQQATGPKLTGKAGGTLATAAASKAQRVIPGYKTASQDLTDDQLAQSTLDYDVNLSGVRGNRNDYALRQALSAAAKDYGLTAAQVKTLADQSAAQGFFKEGQIGGDAKTARIAIPRGLLMQVLGAGPVRDQYEKEKADPAFAIHEQIRDQQQAPQGPATDNPYQQTEAQQNMSGISGLLADNPATPENFNSLTDREQRRLDAYHLTPDEQQEAQSVGGQFASEGKLGTFMAGITGSAGRTLSSLAGILRFGTEMMARGEGMDLPPDWLSTLSKEGTKFQTAAGTEAFLNPGTFSDKAIRIGAGLAGDLPRYLLLSRLPGGMPVVFGVDAGLQDIGAGERPEHVAAVASKGAIEGAIFQVAPKVAQMAEGFALKALKNPVFEAGIENTPVEKLAAKIFGEGARIGTIAHGTATVQRPFQREDRDQNGRITNSPSEDAFWHGITMALTDVAMRAAGPLGNGIKGLAGKVFRATQGDQSATGTVMPNGDVKLLKGSVDPNFVDIDMVFDPVEGIYKAQDPFRSTKQIGTDLDGLNKTKQEKNVDVQETYDASEQGQKKSKLDETVRNTEEKQYQAAQDQINEKHQQNIQDHNARLEKQRNTLPEPAPSDSPTLLPPSTAPGKVVNAPDLGAIEAVGKDRRVSKITEALQGKDFTSVDEIAKATRFAPKNVLDTLLNMYGAGQLERRSDGSVRLVQDENPSLSEQFNKLAENYGKTPPADQVAPPVAASPNVPTAEPAPSQAPSTVGSRPYAEPPPKTQAPPQFTEGAGLDARTESLARRDQHLHPQQDVRDLAARYNLTPEEVESLRPMGEIGKFGHMAWTNRLYLLDPKNREDFDKLSEIFTNGELKFDAAPYEGKRADLADQLLDRIAQSVGKPRSSQMDRKDWETVLTNEAHRMPITAVDAIVEGLEEQSDWHKAVARFVNDPDLEKTTAEIEKRFGISTYQDLKELQKGAGFSLQNKKGPTYEFRKAILDVGRRYAGSRKEGGPLLADDAITRIYDAYVRSRFPGTVAEGNNQEKISGVGGDEQGNPQRSAAKKPPAKAPARHASAPDTFDAVNGGSLAPRGPGAPSRAQAVLKEVADVPQGLQVDIGPSLDNEGGLTLHDIHTTKRGKGLASAFMRKLTDAADKYGVVVDLEVGPKDDIQRGVPALSGPELADFYKRHGFEWTEAPVMERRPRATAPQPQAAIAEKPKITRKTLSPPKPVQPATPLAHGDRVTDGEFVGTYSQPRAGEPRVIYTNAEGKKITTRDTARFRKISEPAMMTAWHGSPHKFDKFDSSKIGTGEGAQAYGHGLYFAGKEEVAQFYKVNLSAPRGSSAKDIAARIYQTLTDEYHPDAEARRLTVKELMRRKDGAAHDPEFQSKMDEAAGLVENGEPLLGVKYKVDLKPAEDEYLLWDKPLSEQSEKVKKAIAEFNKIQRWDDLGNEWLARNADGQTIARIVNRDGGFEVSSGRTLGDYHSTVSTIKEAKELGTRIAALTIKGSEFYQSIARRFARAQEDDLADGGWKFVNSHDPADPSKASEYLKSLGIRGIKYLDGSSRGKGEGDYNYVIFDDSDVEIEDVMLAKGGFDAASLRATDQITDAWASEKFNAAAIAERARAAYVTDAPRPVVKINTFALYPVSTIMGEWHENSPLIHFGAELDLVQTTLMLNSLARISHDLQNRGETAAGAAIADVWRAFNRAMREGEGDVAFAVDVPGVPEIYSRYAMPEELLHQADFRLHEFQHQDRSAYETFDIYGKAAKTLSEGPYAGTSPRGIFREVKAKMFLDAAGEALGLTDAELSDLRNFHYERITADGATPEEVRVRYDGITNAATEFANYGERTGSTGQRNGGDTAAPETEVSPGPRSLPEVRADGHPDRRPFAEGDDARGAGTDEARRLFEQGGAGTADTALALRDPGQKSNLVKWFGRSVVRNADGLPKRVLHGTSAGEITSFHPGTTFFTDSPKAADLYRRRSVFSDLDVEYPEDVSSADELGDEGMGVVAGEEGVNLDEQGAIYPAYIKIEKPLDLRSMDANFDPASDWDALHRLGVVDERWGDLDEDQQDEVEQEFGGKALWNFLDSEGHDTIRRAGYDGVIFNDVDTRGRTHTTYAVFSPNQIKSAIGNNGDFDPSRDEIVFSRPSADDLDEGKLEERAKKDISVIEKYIWDGHRDVPLDTAAKNLIRTGYLAGYTMVKTNLHGNTLSAAVEQLVKPFAAAFDIHRSSRAQKLQPKMEQMTRDLIRDIAGLNKPGAETEEEAAAAIEKGRLLTRRHIRFAKKNRQYLEPGTETRITPGLHPTDALTGLFGRPGDYRDLFTGPGAAKERLKNFVQGPGALRGGIFAMDRGMAGALWKGVTEDEAARFDLSDEPPGVFDKDLRKSWQRNFGSPVMDGIMEFVKRLAIAVDRPAKEFGRVDATRGLARLKAKQTTTPIAGESKAEFAKRWKERMHEMETDPGPVIAQLAKRYAETITFQNPNYLMKWLDFARRSLTDEQEIRKLTGFTSERAIKTAQNFGRAFDFALTAKYPFLRTLSNMGNLAAEYTPVGFAVAAWKMKQIGDGWERDDWVSAVAQERAKQLIELARTRGQEDQAFRKETNARVAALRKQKKDFLEGRYATEKRKIEESPVFTAKAKRERLARLREWRDGRIEIWKKAFDDYDASRKREMEKITGARRESDSTQREVWATQNEIAGRVFTEIEAKMAAEVAGRAGFGTLIGGLILLAVVKGLIDATGTTDYDSEKDRAYAKRAAGIPDSSVKIGSRRYPFDMVPFGMAMKLGLDTLEQSQRPGSSQMRTKAVLGRVGSDVMGLNPLTSQEFGRDDWASTLGSYSVSLTPVVNLRILQEIGEITDKQPRSYWNAGFAAQYLMKIPPIPGLEDEYPNRTDLPVSKTTMGRRGGSMLERFGHLLDPTSSVEELSPQSRLPVVPVDKGAGRTRPQRPRRPGRTR